MTGSNDFETRIFERPPAQLVLTNVGRAYSTEAGDVAALKDVSLSIAAGEMVAIIGPSGSGKSTLLNVIGCLDRPTSGDYRIAGTPVAALAADTLAALRREHFGFVFQRYHLLSDLSAAGNTEMPSIYAGADRETRGERAEALLCRLGLSDRVDFRPSQLSGGQQQRVSIARALMNDADVILADEPTGSLDKRSGEDVLAILDTLNCEGRTIIIVTHDMAVARHARRIIEISDGEIVADRVNIRPDAPERLSVAGIERPRALLPSQGGLLQACGARLGRLSEAFSMATRSLLSHRLRTLLTMLGIIIGIASVVIVVALGEGARVKVLSDIASLGTNTLEVFPGKDFGDRRSDKVRTLVLSDANELARQPFVVGVTPTVNTSTMLRLGPVDLNAQTNGVGADFFQIKGMKLAAGRVFGADAVQSLAPEVVIDDNTHTALTAAGNDRLIGTQILVGNVPATIVGILEKQHEGFGSPSMLTVYLPYSTVQARFTGAGPLRSLLLRISDTADMTLAQQAVSRFLKARHGAEDFFIINTDDIRKTITSTAATLTLLVAAIAVVSLIVGGIGVMNIMLVAVSERVTEIGVRMAVGARRSDILEQFLTEAVLVCLVGGILGILLAVAAGQAFTLAGTNFRFIYSANAMIIAVLVSTLIGVVFGYLPARRAAMLDPVTALVQ
jgi:macrolide transport system ATP-binding/permease protein